MATLRTTLWSLALLALAGCASTPPAPAMTVTPVPCSYGCDYGGPDDYYYSYGTAYPYYPVLVPLYPVVTPPSTPPSPVTPPPLPSPPPPPPPKIHIREPVERPCPRTSKVCP